MKLAKKEITISEFKASKVAYSRRQLIDTFDELEKYDLLWKVVHETLHEKVYLVNLLFEVVTPEIEDGVVLPYGFNQAMSIFQHSINSCGRDIECIRQTFISLLDYVELYFGSGYQVASKIKQYQKNTALVDGHEAVSNLRVGEVVGYPQTLPEVTSLPNIEEIDKEND